MMPAPGRHFADECIAHLRRSGIAIRSIEIDLFHPQTAQPAEVVRQPHGHLAHFYRRLFRWKTDDGAHGSVLLEPILVRASSNESWREDPIAQWKHLVELVSAHERARLN